jgi:flavin-binding protein dodecin
LLGGPAGLAIGALTGTVIGNIADLWVAGVGSDFLDEVSNVLTPGKYAIVADISEEWVTPLDTRMEALNGFVFRTTKKSFEEALNVAIKRISKSIRGVRGVDVIGQKVILKNGKVVEYRVHMKVSFAVEEITP